MKYIVTFTYTMEVEDAEAPYHAVQQAWATIREDTPDSDIVEALVATFVQVVEDEEGN